MDLFFLWATFYFSKQTFLTKNEKSQEVKMSNYYDWKSAFFCPGYIKNDLRYIIPLCLFFVCKAIFFLKKKQIKKKRDGSWESRSTSGASECAFFLFIIFFWKKTFSLQTKQRNRGIIYRKLFSKLWFCTEISVMG